MACAISSHACGHNTPISAPSQLANFPYMDRCEGVWSGGMPRPLTHRPVIRVTCTRHVNTEKLSGENENRKKRGWVGWPGIKNFLLHRYTVLEWLLTEQLILFIPDPPFLYLDSCILPRRYARAINQAVRMRTHYAHQPVNPLLHVNCV